MRISYTAQPTRAELREVARGVFLWLPGTATFTAVDLDGAPYTVQLVLDTRDGEIRPVSVTVTAPSGSPPVTGTTLRAVRIAELTRTGILAGVQRGRRKSKAGGTGTEILSPGLGDKDLELLRLRGPVRESLEVLAWVYNLAGFLGLPPAKQAGLELGLPRATVTRWVRRAKDMGLIGPAEGE